MRYFSDSLDQQATTVTFLIPEGYVSSVIGKGGQHLDDVNQMTGCSMTMDKPNGSVDCLDGLGQAH